MGVFGCLNKNKRERKGNIKKRKELYKYLPFSEVGRVVSIGKALDKEANKGGDGWSLTDLVVIYFVNKEERYYRGIIKATDMCMSGFIPKYGQTYRFHSKTRPVHRESHVILELDHISSV